MMIRMMMTNNDGDDDDNMDDDEDTEADDDLSTERIPRSHPAPERGTQLHLRRRLSNDGNTDGHWLANEDYSYCQSSSSTPIWTTVKMIVTTMMMAIMMKMMPMMMTTRMLDARGRWLANEGK